MGGSGERGGPPGAPSAARQPSASARVLTAAETNDRVGAPVAEPDAARRRGLNPSRPIGAQALSAARAGGGAWALSTAVRASESKPRGRDGSTTVPLPAPALSIR